MRRHRKIQHEIGLNGRKYLAEFATKRLRIQLCADAWIGWTIIVGLGAGRVCWAVLAGGGGFERADGAGCAGVVSLACPPAGDAARCCFRTRLDGALYVVGHCRLVGLALWWARAGTAAIMGLAVGGQCAVEPGVLRVTQPRRGTGSDTGPGGVNRADVARLLASAALGRMVAGAVSGLGLLCHLSECWLLVVEPWVR